MTREAGAMQERNTELFLFITKLYSRVPAVLLRENSTNAYISARKLIIGMIIKQVPLNTVGNIIIPKPKNICL
jgi:hypothetical protein